MPVKSADWVYQEDDQGGFSSIDLLTPKGDVAGVVLSETDPITGGISFQSSGNVAAVVARRNTVMLFGDSITDRSWVHVALQAGGITNNGDGTATATMAAAPNGSNNQLALGDTIRVNGSSTPLFNQLAATITAVSNSPTYSITYSITGRYSDAAMSDGPYVTVYSRNSVKGWWTYFQALANADFTVVADCSQGGGQLAAMKQILDRQYPTTYARFGFLLGGINDIYVGSRSLAQMKTDAAALIDAAIGRVGYLVVFTIPAMSNSKSGWTLALANQQLQFNKWLVDYCNSKGAIVVESNLSTSNSVTYASGSDTNGAPNSGFVADFTHPSAVGAYALAVAALAKVNAFLIRDAKWPSNAIDSLYYNSSSEYMLDASHVLLSGTGGTKSAGSGTISGTAPDGTTVAWASGGSGLTATLTSPARTVGTDGDAVGSNLVATFTGTSAGSSLLRVSVATTVGRFSLGDVIRAMAKIKIASPVGILAVNVVARVVQASMARQDSASCEETDSALTEGCTRYDVSPWAQIKSANGALTSVTFQVDIWTAASGSVTGSVTIAHPNIQKQIVS